jgi:hypothetical protein
MQGEIFLLFRVKGEPSRQWWRTTAADVKGEKGIETRSVFHTLKYSGDTMLPPGTSVGC